LAAILFPVFAQAREKARAASCVSNLKQMGTAWMMYAQDYDERFPSSNGGSDAWDDCRIMKYKGSFGGWIGNLLMPYTKNVEIFQCPSNRNLSPVNNRSVCAAIAGAIDYQYTSYGYNYNILWSRGLADLPRPTEQIAIADGISAWWDCPIAQQGSCGIWYEREIPAYLAKVGKPLHPAMLNPYAPGNWVGGVVNRAAPHSNLVNYMFADGHVKASGWDRLTWGNLAGPVIPENHPDYNVPLTTLPTQRWPWPISN
jgi:prepilin-type processing-associated H-X9-DG protein